MNNRTGYILGLSSGVIYTIINYVSNFKIMNFIAILIGALIVPLILTYLITLFPKSLEFGRTFGIISIVIHIIATIGKLNS